MICEEGPDGWDVVLDDGRRIPWRGFYTGPLTLDESRVAEICRDLLGHGLEELPDRVDGILRPATGETASWPALLLHSTTPELKAFQGELHAVVHGRAPGDLTTYKETRSVYLAADGDVAVGRTRTWRSAVEIFGAEAVELPDTDHYYLSHALLHLAATYRDRPCAAIGRLLDCLRGGPRRVRLYACEPEMQIFLCWLARTAGLDQLPVEANRPALSAAWNRKDVLHPTVEEALALEPPSPPSPARLLELESNCCGLARRMGITVPTVPGYTIERRRGDAGEFARQLIAAARLLGERYGLDTGCLKASEAGDGARITPGLALVDTARLEELGREAYGHGDDYVLEAHVDYLRPRLAGHELPTALSAHIRGGRVAPGATIQFVRGTSWKGNVFFDEETASLFQIPASQYGRLRSFVESFQEAFERREPGLVLAGIDFALGTVGGAFDDEVLLGVQDLNISFTGAECLRVFLDKVAPPYSPLGDRVSPPPESPRGDRAAESSSSPNPPYAVTRVYRPRAAGDHAAFRQVTARMTAAGLSAETIASIPGRWAMVGITGADPVDALENLTALERSLQAEELIEDP